MYFLITYIANFYKAPLKALLNVFEFSLIQIHLWGLQISRSIGDVYLKKTEFNREPLYSKFRLREPFNKPILCAEPSTLIQPLQQHDKFLIFASDGLWEHITNQEAVDIVQNHPRNVSML